MKTTLLMVFAALTVAHAADTGKIIYREGFDRYGDTYEIFTDACKIREAPPSLKQLHFTPKSQTTVYKKNCEIPGTDCRNYDFTFRFMFPEKEGKRALEAELFASTDGKAVQRYGIVIAEERYAINTPPTDLLLANSESKTADMLLPVFPARQWHTAIVSVRGQNISLSIGDKVITRRRASAEYNGAPLTAFNFRSATPFVIDDIIVRKYQNEEAKDFAVKNGVSTATHNAVYSIDVPSDATRFSAEVQLGSYPGQMKILFEPEEGASLTLNAQTFSYKQMRTVKKDVVELVDGQLVTTPKYVNENVLLPDAGFAFNCLPPSKAWNMRWYVRPLLQFRYQAAEIAAIIDGWEEIPSASERFVHYDIRPSGTNVAVWIDGRYATTLELPSRLKRTAFVVPAGAAIRKVQIDKTDPGLFLSLDVSKHARPGVMKDARIQGAPGDQVIKKIPFHVADGAGSADTGICEENYGSYYLECDGYLQRTAFEGNLHSILFAVPVAQYTRAWALCAVEDNLDKETEITARLTKFLSSGQGPAFADTTLTLPRDGKSTDDRITPAGKIEFDGKILPLYLVRFDLDAGAIQDLIFQNGNERLDFEFVGKLHDGDNFYMDMRRKPSLTKKSGVHIFGATLERAPFEFCVLPTKVTNVYDPSTRPAMEVQITAMKPGKCTIKWRVHNIEGKELEQGSKAFSFSKRGEKAAYQVKFGQKQFGWYGVTFRLVDDSGGEIKHEASFALIDTDKRKAGYESLYFIWNYNGAGGTPSDMDLIGGILKTLGVRRTLPPAKLSEADVAKYQLTRGQLNYLNAKARTDAEVLEELEPKIKDLVAKYPHSGQALIFHESGGGPFPMELFGEKTELTDEIIAGDKAFTGRAISLAKAWRKVAPEVKLSVGNAGSSLGLVARLFRQKYPRELIDYIGDETGSGSSVPSERSVPAVFWFMRELARIYDYDGVEPTACFEWSTRRLRQNGPRKNAELRIRDSLVALAWNSQLIPLTTLCEPTSAYFNTVWGEAALTRSPELYPLPVFPAIATLTQVLDGAKFTRLVPTGSATVYALEFVRGKEFVYALWTARGELDVALTYEKETKVLTHGFYGAQSEEQAKGGKLAQRLTTAPFYLTGTVPLLAVDGSRKRTFEREPVPQNLTVACTVADTNIWGLIEGIDPRFALDSHTPESFGGRRPGKFELQSVQDEERGDCLELVHTSAETCPPLMYEYVMIKNANPVTVAGVFSTIGLWVKGNSSWGKIYWEIEDAEGERWTSAGSGGYGCSTYDWADQAGINFDGWHLLQFPITAESPITVASPGANELQWQHDGSGNHQIDFPVKVTGFGVAVPSQTLNLKAMEPVKANLRFGDIILN